MAKYRFRGSIKRATFPLVSTLQPRTVVEPGADNNVKTPQTVYGSAESADYSIPQLLYCENVMPTAEGITSVAYETVIAPHSVPTAAFDQAIILRDADEKTYLFCPASGANYIYSATAQAWVSTNPIDGVDTSIVSRAYVNGRTFICYSNVGLFEYNSSTDTFAIVPLTGITATDIRGIGASNNYLLAYTDITVHWSSLVDPTDFTPSLETGAGFLTPQDVKAQITAIGSTAAGFIVYTAKNAVSAVYSQNIRSPFIFREVSNAGGVDTYEQITVDASSGMQFAWTTSGLQSITSQKADPVSAEVNDFLAGTLWEYWDAISSQLLQVRSAAVEFKVKITYVASRYLVVSYSISNSNTYEYALVFDLGLKRWGKLKIDHRDCFTYAGPELTGDLSYEELGENEYQDLGLLRYSDLATGIPREQPSKRVLAFLSADGTVKIARIDYEKVTADAVAIFGKFQLTRARVMVLRKLELEGILGQDCTVKCIASWDGKNLDVAAVPTLLQVSENYLKYGLRLRGVNISVVITGAFALSTYLLEALNDGDR